MVEEILIGFAGGIIAAIGLFIIVVVSVAMGVLDRKRGWGLSPEQWTAFAIMAIGYTLLWGGLWVVFMV